MDNRPKQRTLIHITADPSTAIFIPRGRRVADYFDADCAALFVHLSAEERQAAEKHFSFARSLQIETRVLAPSAIAKTVVELARRNQVTQVFVAHSEAGLLERLPGNDFTGDIVCLAQNSAVTATCQIFTENARTPRKPLNVSRKMEIIPAGLQQSILRL